MSAGDCRHNPVEKRFSVQHPRRRISTKLAVSYIVLNLVLISAVSAFFYHYNRISTYQDGINNLVQSADSMISQTDSRLTSMEQVAVDVLIHVGFSDSWKGFLRDHSEISRSSVGAILNDVYKSKSDIRSVAVYTADGTYVCTGNSTVTAEQVSRRADELQIDSRFSQYNSRIFLGPHKDFWNPDRDGLVISEIKPIKDREKNITGYIEVQQNCMYLDKACSVSWNGKKLNVFIFNDDNEALFYKNPENGFTDEQVGYFEEQTKQYMRVREDSHYIFATISSNYYAYRGIVILPKAELYRSLRGLLLWIMFAACLLSATMVLYVILLTRKIMSPINTFVEKMKKVDLKNLPKPEKKEYRDYETEILGTSFDNMTVRFQNTFEREKKLEGVQMKTLFAILQKEISPHFLYNTLGSIANMCEAGDNDDAAEACYNLTDIIRYASDYKTRDVSLKEELDQLRSYLAIMKSRYRQRLIYEVQVSDDIYYFQLPKLTIQPIVENAIKYSLMEQDQVRIKVRILHNGGCAEIHVSDNGCGITEKDADAVREKVSDSLEKNVTEDVTKDVRFGGMGLCGTLIRLSIFFGSAFRYELVKNEAGGTTVSLYINLQAQDAEVENV
jgi:two-component system sensor histidine kinase YesM